MAVPSQNELHRPILEMASKVQQRISLGDIKEDLVARLGLTDDDLAEMVPSRTQTRFDNRVYWAVSYLRRAGLLHSPIRAHFEILEAGREFLARHAGEIKGGQLQILIDAQTGQPKDEALSNEISSTTDTDESITPTEQISRSYDELQRNLSQEILDSIIRVPPDRFERLVVQLLVKMGYGQGEAVGRSGDGGIDGIINQDALGLERVYVQAKHYTNGSVGEPDIRNFAGSLIARGATKGVFITTARFSETARQTAENVSRRSESIRLVDGNELAQLMIRHGVGVVTEYTYEIKKLDENYFAEEI